MKPPLEFDEYLKKGVARKTREDISRANFLIDEVSKSFLGLKKRIKVLGIDEYSSNSIIKDCYDIIMESIRAKMFIAGYSCSGNFSHEAEVSYSRKLGFSKAEVEFMNEVRFLRNRIIYYGRQFDEEYAKKVYDFLIKIKEKLK